ncbi:MAG: hypothetical protein L3J36_09100 [Rhodobacteraceae bacterium]|nr:hypothetical protein [Paracoccaceae bacterium]
MEKKYAQLESHLVNRGFESIKMTFSEIESVISGTLPASARKHRAWWSNNPSNSVITYAWLAAGYKTSAVNMEGETLVFRKLNEPDAGLSPMTDPDVEDRPYPSIFGCMKGTITFIEGVDLTDPADPEWAKSTENPKLYNE